MDLSVTFCEVGRRMFQMFINLFFFFEVLIFPEGTDLTKKSIMRSNLYADKNNLQHYSKVLHPKTTGFAYLVKKMRSSK